MNSEKRSPHVLNAASNLLGICLIIQTSIRVLGYSSKSYIDEWTAIATCCFMGACLFSYMSLRSRNAGRSERLERVADIGFLAGLILLFALVMLISINEIS